ncbi:hypothetical protein HGP14_33255 [Rhizobium sp. P32RR-XVIII]|uniref:DUF4286 family protein n=1 Tax=Rhizobium sp. P32RR-XVIII TaxID=2726738 RepID=UPI0014579596|nr:DUF4286 family protein [Rhizobium sp. P32RR-XVIII]NLS08065.1 hypothetical protein [Rhizobium sp. P32RR-XVIII]
MALAGSAVLAIWNGIKPEAEDEFVTWHVREHIPERVGLPGFLRGRRYVALDGNPKYFNFYETESVADLSSPAYLARLDAPTPWTKSVVAHFTDTSRTICAVALSRGRGDGAALMTLQLSTSHSAAVFTQAMQAIIVDALDRPGVVGAHLLQGDPKASNQQTAEKKLRDKADEIASWILLIEAVGPEAFDRLQADLDLPNRLGASGCDEPHRKGTYLLQYALSNNQL